MQTSIQQIELDAQRWCIHLNPPYDYPAAIKTLTNVCKRAGKSLAIAEVPRPESFRFRLLRRPDIYDWFCAKTNSTLHDAKQMIADLPIHIHPDFRCNAMNPMRILGLAAAIAERTDVLVYEPSGMDPIGIGKIHKYAREQYRNGCLIHVCWCPITDACPNVGACVSVNINTENMRSSSIESK